MTSCPGSAVPATEPEDGPHAWWHVAGLCDNHRRHERNGERTPVAEYWVLHGNGYWFSECNACCTTTRSVGAESPDLMPVRITTHA
jgi:hypothetical protein